MNIAVIGGLSRQVPIFQALAAAAGHQLEMHSGEMGGRGSHDLQSVVERSELVAIITDTNSHGAVQVARKTVRRAGRPVLLLRRFGVARLARLLDALSRADAFRVAQREGLAELRSAS